MSRLARIPIALALLLGAGLLSSARAQDVPVEGEEEGGGDAVVAYAITGALGFGAIFVLCKSARR